MDRLKVIFAKGAHDCKVKGQRFLGWAKLISPPKRYSNGNNLLHWMSDVLGRLRDIRFFRKAQHKGGEYFSILI